MFSRNFLIFAAVFQTSVLGFNWNSGDGTKWSSNCDWNGGDIGGTQSSGEQCGGKCRERSGCTHFVWTNYNGGTCWLKHFDSPQTAVAKNDGNPVCGWVEGSGPSPGGQSGKTTRYWDCCKPSCSWGGKASVNNPVQSCQRDGVTPVDAGATSGCGGGTSYTCNKQIPWIGNNNVAYGFAAAAIQGLTERDTCCACYELTFTSGPVSGQKMIVQVTNTGSDLSNNHFDLQIPGGGVGIYNGCSSQWGAGPTGWGRQYGGVSSAEECAQLPVEIRDGCHWRFTWFKNADNPDMQFRPVSCPAELTAKTGCIRQ